MPFDDCCYGHFIYDLAMMVFYHGMGHENDPAFLETFLVNFFNGYRAQREHPIPPFAERKDTLSPPTRGSAFRKRYRASAGTGREGEQEQEQEHEFNLSPLPAGRGGAGGGVVYPTYSCPEKHTTKLA